MIRNRPNAHSFEPHYRGLPPAPYAVDFETIPELIKLSLFPLRHIEPMTSSVANLIGEIIEDSPNTAEMEFYNDENSDFQYVFVVINSIFDRTHDGVSYLLPYSVSLIPASKRGIVELSKVDFVQSMIDSEFLKGGAAYLGLDPFVGEWQMWSQVGLIAEIGAKNAYTDEMGLVYDYYFLRTDFVPSEVIQAVTIDMPSNRLRNYLKHRSKLLYTPFDKFQSRQIWGIENGLELFVFQEIKRRNMPIPVPQAMVFGDGTWHPSLYNAWQSFADDDDFISSVDFYYPDLKLAIFCDGATHRRAAIKSRDEKIDQRLLAIGIRSVRIPSRDILRNVEQAVSKIQDAF